MSLLSIEISARFPSNQATFYNSLNFEMELMIWWMLTLMLLFQGCIFIQPFHSHISASAIHWTVHWFFADFRFSLILNLPLVVCFYYRGVYLSNLSICKFPLQLNIEPSTDCLQISASAIHWNFHCLSADIGLILNLPLVVCLRLGPSASGFGLRPPAAALRAARLRRFAPSALRACGASWIQAWNLHLLAYEYHISNILIWALYDSVSAKHWWVLSMSPVICGARISTLPSPLWSKFTKNHYWLFLVPPYSLQKLIWDGSGLVGMRAHPPCIAGVPFKLISYDLVLFCRL